MKQFLRRISFPFLLVVCLTSVGALHSGHFTAASLRFPLERRADDLPAAAALIQVEIGRAVLDAEVVRLP